DVDRRDRERRLLDHERRGPALRRELVERRSGEREMQRVTDRLGDVVERLAGQRGAEHQVVVACLGNDDAGVVEQRDAGHVPRRAAAAVIPSAMKMPPESQRRSFAPVPLRRSRPAIASATNAYVMSESTATSTNNVPRNATCGHTAPRSGSTNCGRKARKKSA